MTRLIKGLIKIKHQTDLIKMKETLHWGDSQDFTKYNLWIQFKNRVFRWYLIRRIRKVESEE